MTLEMRGICKSFGSNDVLKHVDFSIQGGEICALLGENGAGKSTLMNILGGVLPADRGEIVIDGAAVHFRTPSDSLSAGVAFIHQELSLINDLAIYENMFIGRELKTKYGLLDAKTMIQKTQEVFDRLELHLDPRTMVRELDASYKQIVEISRAMMMEASLIIMDAPPPARPGRPQTGPYLNGKRADACRTCRCLNLCARSSALPSANCSTERCSAGNCSAERK